MDNPVTSPNDFYIPNGVTFVGTIHAPGLAKVNGSVTGEITSQVLDIGPQGNVQGKVRAEEIDVHGVLMDDVVCQGLLQIRKTGKVAGKLSYVDIDIERGGQFEGDMIHSAH